MKKISLTKQQKQVYKLLDFFMRYCNTGLLFFFREAYYPDDETMYEMIQARSIDEYKREHNGAVPESVHVQGNKTPYAQAVVEAADSVRSKIRRLGGIQIFWAAFAELSKTRSRNMNILRDLSRRAGTCETIADIAEKNYLSDPQITNIKKRTMRALAINVSGRCETKRFFNKTEENNNV